MKNWRYTLCLLYIIPFVNIFKNRGMANIILPILGILFLLIFLSCKFRRIPSSEKKVYNWANKLVVSICFMVIISRIYGIDNIDMIIFFCSFPYFFFLFRRICFLPDFVLGPFINYLRYLIVIITTSIIVDYFLLKFGMLTMQPMYREEAWSYFGRPFGIFGQPSVNSTLLCLFYLLYTRLKKVHNIFVSYDSMFILTTIGCIVQGSGSGFLSYAFVLFNKFSSKKNVDFNLKKKLPYIIVCIILLYIIIMSNIIDKLSINYINVLIEFCNENIVIPYLNILKNPINLWFGFSGNVITIDLGPLYLIASVGLFYFIIISFFTLSLFKKARSSEMKLSILLLLVGNLLYPVMFYFIMNVVWFFIYYIILVIENGTKEQYRNSNVCL